MTCSKGMGSGGSAGPAAAVLGTGKREVGGIERIAGGSWREVERN